MRSILPKYLRVWLLSSILLVGFGSANLLAQMNMIRTTFTGAYTPIDTLSGATKSTAVGDDVFQDNLPIGFTFTYLGTPYTTFGVNTNGAGAFSGISTSAANTNLFTTTAPNTTVTAWWDDMSVVAGTGIILYQTQGTPGNQTFTVQWTNVNSYYTTATQRLNFQVVLYEGTNVIELKYGTVVAGVANTSESASIGIEGAGGPGNYIDGVTGSSFVGHAFMTAATKWPVRHIRYTPGTPTPIPAGTYTVGVGQTYPTLNSAVADLNHRGVAGPVVFTLTDAQYDVNPTGGDNIFPVIVGPVAGTSLVNNVQIGAASGYAILRYDGETAGNIANQGSTSAMGTGTEPIIGLAGASFIGFRNLDLQCSATGVVDRGIGIINSSATLGSQNNAFNNIKVSLNRGNTSSMGIEQRAATTPTAATGANSNNLYGDLQISNVYNGIFLTGNASFPDAGCQITTSTATLYNTIGAATADDIGNGTSQTYGIRLSSQADAVVNNNIVRNVTGTGLVDGILVELGQGSSRVFNNKISNLRNSSTTSTSGVTGIRANLATTGSHTLRVYNNFVSGLTSSYTGTASATRQIKGIYAQSAGGGVSTLNTFIDHNSVSIDGSASPTISSSCFEIGTTSGPVFTVRNNVFANFTAAQTGLATHSAWYSTSATAIGNTGSVSNFNDLFVANTTNGAVGTGNGTAYATLAAWQTATTADANSISAAPSFNNNVTDLHTTGLPLNNAGTPIASITVDIDNQARSATTPDIGADEFAPATLDMAAISLNSPTAAGCYTATQSVAVVIRNNGLAAIDFTVNPCTLNVAITGAATANLQFIINNNSLNGGLPLNASANLTVTAGTFNMSAAGTYVFNANVVTSGDANAANDAISQVSIAYSAGTAIASRTSLCQGDSTNLMLTGNTSTSIQWQSSTDGGTTWTNIPGATTSSVWHTPTAPSTIFRSLMCGSLASSSTSAVVVTQYSTPTTFGDTVCGLDTLHLSATGSGTLNWYANATGGTPINQGSTYNVVVPSTTTFYVSNVSGGGTITVGPTTNAIGGGGQQTSAAYNIFDVIQPCVLQGVYAYPGAAGNVVVDLRNSAGTLIQQVVYPVTAADVNNRTWIPLNMNLTVGTGFRLAQGTGSVSMYRNSSGVTVPYTSAAVNITGASSSGFYYFFYEWHLLVGCESSRVPVVGTVNTPPAMTAAAASPSICNGGSTTLTATSANTGYSYTWSPATGLSGTTGATVTATPASTIDYIVEASDAQNCLARDTVTVNVNYHPLGTITASDTLICIGDTATIDFVPSATTFGNPSPVAILDNTPAGSYSLATVSGLSGTLSSNSIVRVCVDVTHTWDSDLAMTLISPSGTQFDLSSNNGGSGDNYTGTCFEMGAATNITAGTAPFTGTYIPEGAGGFATFNGENPNGVWSIWLVDNASGDFGSLNFWTIEFIERPKTYSWTSSPSGFTANTASISVMPTVTTTYMLNVADSASGCDTTYMYTLDVNPALSASISGAPTTTVCPGTTVNLTGSATGGDSNYNYTWNGGASGSTFAVTVNTDTTIVLSVTDGCTTPMANDSVQINITVNPPIVATITGGSATVCAGTVVNLSSTVTGGNGVYVYDWNGLGSTNGISVTVNSDTTIILNVSDTCSTPMASDTITIMVNPALTVSTTGGGAVCAGQAVTISATVSGGDGSPVYAWSAGGSASSITVNPTATTTYTVSVTDGCNATPVTSSQTVTVTALPVAGFTSTLTGNLNYSFTNTSTNGTTYSWTFGDGTTSTVANPTHLYTAGGNYTVCLTTTNACGSDSSCTSLTLVANDQAFADGSIHLWPNPTTGKFIVRVEGLTESSLNLELFNVAGQKVYAQAYQNLYHSFQETIDANVTKGVYFLRVSDGIHTQTLRVVIQ